MGIDWIKKSVAVILVPEYTVTPSCHNAIPGYVMTYHHYRMFESKIWHCFIINIRQSLRFLNKCVSSKKIIDRLNSHPTIVVRSEQSRSANVCCVIPCFKRKILNLSPKIFILITSLMTLYTIYTRSAMEIDGKKAYRVH